MKHLIFKKLFLVGLISSCVISNAFGMGKPPRKKRAAISSSTEQAAATSSSSTEQATASSSSTAQVAANTLSEGQFDLTLPDHLLLESLTHSIIPQQACTENHEARLNTLEDAIIRLKELRLVNHRFRNLLTNQIIFIILENTGLIEQADIFCKGILGSTLLLEALNMGKVNLAHILIDNNININSPFQANQQNPTTFKYLPLGITPLHMAARKGYRNLFKLLLARGADIISKIRSPNADLNNATPLDFARRGLENAENELLQSKENMKQIRKKISQAKRELRKIFGSEAVDLDPYSRRDFAQQTADMYQSTIENEHGNELDFAQLDIDRNKKAVSRYRAIIRLLERAYRQMGLEIPQPNEDQEELSEGELSEGEIPTGDYEISPSAKRHLDFDDL